MRTKSTPIQYAGNSIMFILPGQKLLRELNETFHNNLPHRQPEQEEDESNSQELDENDSMEVINEQADDHVLDIHKVDSEESEDVSVVDDYSEEDDSEFEVMSPVSIIPVESRSNLVDSDNEMNQ